MSSPKMLLRGEELRLQLRKSIDAIIARRNDIDISDLTYKYVCYQAERVVLRVFPNARIQNVRQILSFDVHQGEDMKFDFINVSAIGKRQTQKSTTTSTPKGEARYTTATSEVRPNDCRNGSVSSDESIKRNVREHIPRFLLFTRNNYS